VYDIKQAYTETVEGYLRLYATEIELELSTKFNEINTQNNRSVIFLEKKLY
jgi:Rps23 Pro-64 3,4-dihydroxylase Tpa1-like proline 4-hydroxylase